MELAPGTRLDRWVVDTPVAQGGMASVYRIRHEQLGSLHALKVLHPHIPAQDRLLAEGRAQSSLAHPNIVSVTDTVSVGGRLGLVMEWVDGPSLADWLQTVLPTAAQIDVLGRDLLRALAFAHERGWVHRDLKPGNVLLQITGDALVPMITDFGLAKQLWEQGPPRTATGEMFGTPAYMAPEQIQDAGGVDARADLFSVGAVLFHLCAGRPPFDAVHPFAVFAQVQSGRRPALREVAPDLPDRFYRAVEQALQVDPEARVGTAEALLRAWTHDGNVAVARPTTPWSPADLDAARPMVQVAASAPPPSPTRRGTGPTLLPRPRTGWGLAWVAVAVVLAAWWLWWTPSPSYPPRISSRPHVQRRFELAWEQWADVRLLAADKTLRSLMRDEPGNPWVQYLLACTLLPRRREEEAARALERAAAMLGPEDELLGQLIAADRLDLGRDDLSGWEAVARRYPDRPLVAVRACTALGFSPDRDAVCERARALDPVPIIDWTLAEEHLLDDDVHTAGRLVEEFLATNPRHPRGLTLQSRLQARLGEWASAEAAARQALELNPALPTARVQLARARAHLGDDAGRDAQMSLLMTESYPIAERVFALREDADTLLGLGQGERAAERLWQAAGLAREARAWSELAMIHVRLGQLGWHLGDVGLMEKAGDALALGAAAPRCPKISVRPIGCRCYMCAACMQRRPATRPRCARPTSVSRSSTSPGWGGCLTTPRSRFWAPSPTTWRATRAGCSRLHARGRAVRSPTVGDGSWWSTARWRKASPDCVKRRPIASRGVRSGTTGDWPRPMSRRFSDSGGPGPAGGSPLAKIALPQPSVFCITSMNGSTTLRTPRETSAGIPCRVSSTPRDERGSVGKIAAGLERMVGYPFCEVQQVMSEVATECESICRIDLLHLFA